MKAPKYSCPWHQDTRADHERFFPNGLDRSDLARIAYGHGNRFPFPGLSWVPEGLNGKIFIKKISSILVTAAVGTQKMGDYETT